jgi:hypothetical protein
MMKNLVYHTEILPLGIEPSPLSDYLIRVIAGNHRHGSKNGWLTLL